MMWEPRYDETIYAQAEAFLTLIQGKRPEFLPKPS